VGKTYPIIDETLRKFIEAQSVYFVATAPMDPSGHINISPKGLDTFRILGDTTVAYLDLTGSGIETVAHLKENSRITVMFCAFQGLANILRLYGRGRVVEPHQAEYAELYSQFPAHLGARSIIVIEVSRIADSCGWGVPHLKYEGERDQLDVWAEKRGADGLRDYRLQKNSASIDGLPGVEPVA
jgi:hypothetical protein